MTVSPGAAATAAPAADGPHLARPQTLEAQEASAIGLSVLQARDQLHSLMDKVLYRWRRLRAYDAADVITFLHATQHAVAGGAAAAGAGHYGAHHALDTVADVTPLYQRETERASSLEQIRSVVQRVGALQAQVRTAQEQVAKVSVAAVLLFFWLCLRALAALANWRCRPCVRLVCEPSALLGWVARNSRSLHCAAGQVNCF
jgi:hypothetical protein